MSSARTRYCAQWLCRCGLRVLHRHDRAYANGSGKPGVRGCTPEVLPRGCCSWAI